MRGDNQSNAQYLGLGEVPTRRYAYGTNIFWLLTERLKRRCADTLNAVPRPRLNADSAMLLLWIRFLLLLPPCAIPVFSLKTCLSPRPTPPPYFLAYMGRNRRCLLHVFRKARMYVRACRVSRPSSRLYRTKRTIYGKILLRLETTPRANELAM